jgi:amino-acid N-acetyltransferase
MTDPVPLEVRPATPDDIEPLDRFIQPFILQERLLPRTHEELRELVEDGFVAIADGRIVGFAALEIYSNKLGEIRSLAVDPAYQRHGIGRALVEACLQRARDRRVFEVMAVTSTEEFFQKCGFHFTLPGEKKALFLQTREHY